MKKKLLIITLFLAICASLLADIQPGYVRTIMRPGKKVQYIENVQIKVKGISGSFRSGKKGRFELELRSLNLKKGSPFSLKSVFRSGFELYDNNLSRVYSPSVPVEIVLRDINQEAKEQQAFARNMYKGAENNYKIKINTLNNQLRQNMISEERYKKELRKYQDLFDKYQANIDVIAKRYAGLDYTNIDPVTEAINVAFSNGDFQLADSLLNRVGSIETQARSVIKAKGEIDEKIQMASAIMDEGLSEREQNSKDAEKLAELAYAKHLSFLNNFQNDLAAYYLELRAQLVPDNSNYQNDAGFFISEYLANYDKALDYYNKALTIAINRNSGRNPYIATFYNNIGIIHKNQSDFPKALEYFEKALGFQLLLGEEHPDVAISYNNIGLVYNSQGDYTKALTYYEKALNIWLKIYGEEQAVVAGLYNNIGSTYNYWGKYAEAQKYYEKALGIKLRIFGEEHPDVALSYHNIGSIYFSLGEYGEALECTEKALKIRQKSFGEDHPDIAVSYNNIGIIYDSQGDYVKALDYTEKALKIRQKLFGEEHSDVALSYNNMGGIYWSLDNYNTALKYYEKALSIWRKLFGEEHTNIAISYNNIGRFYKMQGDYTTALKYYEKALNIQQKIFGEKHPDVALSYRNIGSIYDSQTDYAKALDFYQKALDLDMCTLGEANPQTAYIYVYIADVYKSMGKHNEALDCYNKSRDIFIKFVDEYHPYIMTVDSRKASLYWISKFAGTELPGYQDFMATIVYTATASDSNLPAGKQGMNGEYIILEFADYDITSDGSVFDKSKELQGKPKDIVVMANNVISQHHFENTIGVRLGLKIINKEEKQRIISEYLNWKYRQAK